MVSEAEKKGILEKFLEWFELSGLGALYDESDEIIREYLDN